MTSPGLARLRRWATVAFGLLVAVLLVRAATQVPWREVGQALRGLPATSIALAVALAVAGHAAVASFDLVGRAVAGHRLRPRTVLRIAAVCYAANQNLGYLVGGVALRVRLYGERGLDLATVAAVTGTAVATNWMGWACVLGVVLVVAPPALPPGWPVGLGTLRAVGGVALVAVAAYVAACFVARRRTLDWRGLHLRLPRGPVALLQVAVGALGWLAMGSIVWAGLPAGTAWAPVLAAMLLAAIAGVIAHVPAGLGVIEGVFLALLADRVPTGPLLAAVLLFRAAYQWLPGLVALVLWGIGRRRGQGAAPRESPAHQDARTEPR